MRVIRKWKDIEDWTNECKIMYTVESYLFRFNNYHKGLLNKHIMMSVFGAKDKNDIKKEINEWYDRCIGAYNEIEFNG